VSTEVEKSRREEGGGVHIRSERGRKAGGIQKACDGKNFSKCGGGMVGGGWGGLKSIQRDVGREP